MGTLPQTIPMNAVVSIQPGVLPAGGSGVDLVGMCLDNTTRVPMNTVQSFPNATTVTAYFGPGSKQSALAAVYFAGFTNSNILPGQLNFTQYNASPVSAYLRGGALGSISLVTLQGYAGSLSAVIDGYTHTAASINLSGSTSFTNAATLIATQLFASEPTEASFTGAIAGTVLTVSVIASGEIAVGQTVVGAGVTAGTVIVSLGTGTGGIGTYNVNNTQTIDSESMTAVATAGTVTYDSVANAFVITSGITGSPSTVAFASGTLAPMINLQSAQGAVLSQGAIAAAPAAFMGNLITITQNWATYFLDFDPDGGSGNAQKLLFAEWNATQNNRWLFSCWDTDASPTVSVPAEACLGFILAEDEISGTALIYEPTDIYLAAFLAGSIAAIDFNELHGRTDMAFRSQSGLVPNVTNAGIASNLQANGYNYYGAFATAKSQFNFFYNGQVSGQFLWIDTYVNQIWLNSNLQVNVITLLTTVKSVPYNAAGANLIESSCSPTLTQAVKNGVIVPGVTLGANQIAEANAAAGVDISGALFSAGYYLQVGIASSVVRAARGSPPITLWYVDGGSVQQINIASIVIQ